MTGSRNQRAFFRVLVSPGRQSRIGLYIGGLALVYSITYILILFNAIQDLHHSMVTAGTGGDWDAILHSVFLRYGILASILFVLFLTSSLVASIVLTHRFYGPLVSIKRFVTELQTGNYAARCLIRENDDVHDLVFELNKLAELLELQKTKEI